MRVLVTGTTPSQSGLGVVSKGLASALVDAGHDVTLAKPSLEQVLDGARWDHAFVGLGALHMVAARHAYGALGVVGTHWESGLTLFLDDADTGKVATGLKTTVRRPESLTEAFWDSRTDHDLASRPEITSWLYDVIGVLLHADRWPGLLVPAFTSDDAFVLSARLGYGASQATKALDLSVYLESPYGELDQAALDQAEADQIPDDVTYWWGTEQPPASRLVRSLGPFSWPVFGMKRLPELLCRADGYLTTQRVWSPRYAQLTSHFIPVVTSWELFPEVVGPSFGVLASTLEVMDATDRSDLAQQQYDELVAHSPSRDDIGLLLNTLLGQSDPALHGGTLAVDMFS